MASKPKNIKVTERKLTVLPAPPKTPPTPAQNNATFTYKSPPLKSSELEYMKARIKQFQIFINGIRLGKGNIVNIIPRNKLKHYMGILEKMLDIAEFEYRQYMINTIKQTGIELDEEYKPFSPDVAIQKLDQLIVKAKEAEIRATIKGMQQLTEFRFNQISKSDPVKCYICETKTRDGIPMKTEHGETVVLCKHCQKEYQMWCELPPDDYEPTIQKIEREDV